MPRLSTAPAESPAPALAGGRAKLPARRTRLLWRLLRWALLAAIWGGVALAALVLWLARDIPRPETAQEAVRRPSLTLEDSAGQVLATYGDVVGTPVRLRDLPAYVPEAAVAVEDRRFWYEFGIDPIGLARATLTNLIHGHIVQGGSTITQQVAKNLFLSNARTLRRKAQELILTFWLARHFTHREILEIWLNRVYFGSGAYGIDAAARLYFGVPARRLSLAQAAVLAGLPRAPSRFNPRTDPQAAAARGRQVLAAMVAAGDITEAQAEAAGRAMSFPGRAGEGGWFSDWAAARGEALLPPDKDAVLRTTLDRRTQAIAGHALTAMLDGAGAAHGVSQGAVVVLDAETGAVRAMIGGRDYADSPYNRATLARRQPGSAFKPFVWLAALEKGVRPEDRVEDAPIRLGNWSPQDFEHRYLGEITVEQALAQSINTAAVRLLLRAGGPRAVAAVAHRLGIEDKLPDDASLALGTGTVGLLELTAAYAPFCNGGRRVSPFAIASVNVGGRTAPAPIEPPAQVVDPALAAEMRQMLEAVVTTGTGRPAALPGRTVAGKTGTTSDYRDAWFVGCTGGRLIGVWMGNDDDTPMKDVLGGTLPARLFHDIAAELR
ncbi:MAG TPA: PBP1A family penicillin-binding protein [Acetobacteraceae bacterium]|nr:PBP1A family penicillin-binding protein [Acetobacteraceae bacterium]